MAELPKDTPRIWLRSFYGFGPEEDGYIGWSEEGPRDRMLGMISAGDLFMIYGAYFPAYRGFMLLVSAGMLLGIWLLLKKTRIGLIIQAALTHPQMASSLGHNVPMVFTIVFSGGCLLAGLAEIGNCHGRKNADD